MSVVNKVIDNVGSFLVVFMVVISILLLFSNFATISTNTANTANTLTSWSNLLGIFSSWGKLILYAVFGIALISYFQFFQNQSFFLYFITLP